MTTAARILELYAEIKPSRSATGTWARESWPRETGQFIVSFDFKTSSYNFTKLMAFENDLYDHLDVETSIEGIRAGCLEVLFATEGFRYAERIYRMSIAGELDWLAAKHRINFLEFHKSLYGERILYED